ncbi:hypothetical protein Pan241w_35190 [Gimesia alba]|uniref:Uncharacterized protein n=1 Tax=Gimesia alba TaxID=2527973 RepID=A0A517RHR6_9PLAN|nr:hypothetical protein [Gimesia alba]QDT43419.1 hypothetical protein Pan241w_35190 [Gimesia alba]
MNLCRFWFSMLLIGIAVQSQQAHAQALRIQQPIVQQFSAGTTLTVPDRGSALIGGFSSGAIRSRQTGPFRRGSNYGHAFQSSSSSVSVYIHDFEAMDRMLLNSAPAALRHSGGIQNRNQHWKQQLLSRQADASTPNRFPASRTSVGTSTRSAEQIAQTKAERFYELGQKAERKHATPNIAILHYRVAEKYGSAPAKVRLQQLTKLKNE